MNQKTIKNSKNPTTTNLTSPIRPSPETMARTVTKTSETKNDTTAESFKPKPSAVLFDNIALKSSDMNIIAKIKTINNTANASNIFLESFLSFKSELPIILLFVLA